MKKLVSLPMVAVVLLASMSSIFVFAQQESNLPDKVVTVINKSLGDIFPSKNSIEEDQNIRYVAGELIVKFKESKVNLKSSQGQAFVTTFAIDAGMAKKETIDTSNIAVMKFEKNISVKDKINQLKANPNIEYAEPNYIYKVQSFNDTYASRLTGLQIIDRYEAIDSFTGSTNTTGTVVAVIDVGVAYDHLDLAANMRDGSSCKSDVGANLGGCMHGYDFANSDKDPYPISSDHGTHVAGTIAAVANNNQGIMGVNPNAKIMAIRAGDEDLSLSAIIKGINFARYNGAKIINASFGDVAYSSGMYDAINSFRSAGGLFFAAAGNDSSNNDVTAVYPCNYNLDNIVCVAATDSNDLLASFSNYGASMVDVGAPGTSILSTAFTGSYTTGMLQDFESLNTGEVPAGWIESGGGSSNRGVSLRGTWGNVLRTDMNTTYTNNADTAITINADTSNSERIVLSFWTVCDTEYTSNGDYMVLEVRPNTSANWTQIGKWNEYTMDIDTIAGNNTGGMTYDKLTYDLSGYYADADFQFRYRRITNSSDNNYGGCLVDDITLLKYTHTQLYGYKSGTSMATPHVAGLASLAWNFQPNAPYTQIRNAIINSGDILPALAGKTVSSRRINAYNTLNAFVDTTPDTFSFTALTGQVRNIVVTGNAITVSGINSGSQISIQSGEYKINASGWTASSGIVYNQDTVTVRLTTATGYLMTNIATLTIGGVTGAFSVTTQANPNAPTCVLLKNPATWTSGSVVLTISGTNGSIMDTGYSFNLSGGFGATKTGTVQTGGTYIGYVQDSEGSIGSCSTGVLIDKTAPIVLVTSHTNNQEITGSSILLGGTATDIGGCGVISILVNDNAATIGSSRSKILTLTGGINPVTITGTDCVGNFTSSSMSIIRKSYITNTPTTMVSGARATIGFTTDLPTQGFVRYGTNSASLTSIATGGTTGRSHSIVLDGLSMNTTYYYQAYAVNDGYIGTPSATASFTMPVIIDPSTITSQVTTTGMIQLSGASANGIAFTTTGVLIIATSGQANNRLEINLSGFTIQTNGWDGVLNPPTTLGGGDTNNATISELGVSSLTNTILLTIQAGSTGSSLVASASNTYFKISFVVASGSSGEKLDLYRSNNGTTWAVNSPDTYCKLDANKLCTFRTDHLSYFTTVRVSSSGGGGGGGGGGSSAETCTSADLICVDGEYEPKSGVYCEGGNLGSACTSTGSSAEDLLNILVNSLSGSGSITNSSFTTERNNAYLYAYKIGITTMSSIKQANMTGSLLRSHMAKMMVNYAINVLDKSPNTSLSCNFSDIGNETIELQGYIKQACQLGIMGQGISLFYPKGKVSRAEFGTVLSRALYGNTYNTGTPYYINHLKNLKTKGIISNTTSTIREIRAYVMLMLMRASATLD